MHHPPQHPAIAVVTGGASGLGAAQCAVLSARGIRVVVADRDRPAADRVAAGLPGAIAVTLDVTDEAGWSTVLAHVRDELGPVGMLVNNAGIVHRRPLAETTADEVRHVMDVNFFGAFHGIRAVVPHLRERGGGAIVNIASTSATMGFAQLTAYGASKAALLAMTRTAAIELASAGIRVNCVLPGLTRSPMNESSTAPGGGLFGRPATPEEVAAFVAFLLSDEASFCTGGEYPVDAGETSVSRASGPPA